MFRKGAGRKGREFSNKATREILSAYPEFSVFYGLLQGFLPSLVLQGLWIPKESFGEAFV